MTAYPCQLPVWLLSLGLCLPGLPPRAGPGSACEKTPKKVPSYEEVVLLVPTAGGYLAWQRDYEGGMLGGMWEFPRQRIYAGEDEARALQRLQQQWQWPGAPELVGRVRHAYSHYKLRLAVYALASHQPLSAAGGVSEGGWHLWQPQEAASRPLHQAHVKVWQTYARQQGLETAAAPKGG